MALYHISVSKLPLTAPAGNVACVLSRGEDVDDRAARWYEQIRAHSGGGG
jgi:hypothetical protein